MKILPLSAAEPETRSDTDRLFNIGYLIEKFSELFHFALQFLENLFGGTGDKNF